jgi:hypothetical protein
VNDTNHGMKPLVDFVVETYCLSLGTPFSFNETTTHIIGSKRVLACNTHFVRKYKRRDYIPLYTCVPSLFIISCGHPT